ncbi:O-antigen ligase [Lysinibacillus composti]|uniref:O-antigen ligase domain-containing protein n=1 Tax=Lysinibacillus composti TaxID=720633 RepID=A0A3N9UHH1_9BACI|nr:O-antigen ligase family protein [Lysinibacillus composti]MBM7609062.1 O-antigen ligase [Lysinibacillus composti]RQW75517.1 O-antigen ligase domain-containing protein [Lysinibacillus composti]
MTSFYGESRQVNKISDEKENQISRDNVDKWIFRLFLVLIGFMPLIVLAHATEFVSPIVSTMSNLTSGVKGDLFTYYKSLIILVVTIIAALLLLSKVLFMNGKVKKTKLNYFLGGFVIVLIISTIVSPNISIALNGLYNRSEGAIMWICYTALIFIAMNINYPKNAVNYVMYSLYPFIFINLFIIIMNFYGKDLLQFEWVQKLVSLFLTGGSQISEGSVLIGTLNQWNYMSGMFSIMTVMFLSYAVVDKNPIRRTINLIVALAAMAVMLMSISASGFVTVVFITVILIWLVIKSENKLKSLAVLVVFAIISGALIHVLSLKNAEVWDESLGFFISENPYETEQPLGASVTTEGLLDLLSNKAYASDNSFELPVLPTPQWGPGTGRIYIWQETLELVADRPLFGYGIDTLVYHFPHTQLEAQANMNEVTIVDKPHNLYVGILYGTGIIGFALFAALLLITLVATIKSIITFNCSSSLIVVLSVAWIAFLVQALFNDTAPGTAGLLFTIAGITLGLFYNEKEANEANV